MARPAFNQRDVERLLRAGRRAGVPVAVRVERATGDLIATPLGETDDPKPNCANSAQLQHDPWEGWDAAD